MKHIIIVMALLCYMPLSAQNQKSLITKLPSGVCPVIDGSIEQLWDTITKNDIIRDFSGETPSLTTYWKAVWNDTAIFVIVSVTDDKHCDEWCSADYTWMSDLVELYFDVNAEIKDGKGPSSTPNGHIQFSPGFENGIVQYSKRSKSSGIYDYNYAYKISNPNYVFEYSIPFSSLRDNKNELLSGNKFGFDVCIIDRDSANESRKRAVWNNTGTLSENYYNMDNAGSAELIQYKPTIGVFSGQSSLQPGVNYTFTYTPIDSMVTKSYVITNGGLVKLNISSVNITGSGYSIIKPEKNLLSLNDSIIIKVKFVQNAVGTYNGSLVITCNDPSNSVFTIGLKSMVISGSSIGSGNVSGTWTKEKSPYLIYGDITIPQNSILTINAGVKVVFQGHYYLNVKGVLRANGSKNDSIYFMRSEYDTLGLSNIYTDDGSWNGLIMNNSEGSMDLSDSSIINYCIFKYSKSNNDGGAIWVSQFQKMKILNTSFYRNYAKTRGGAIFLKKLDDILIKNCSFTENYCADMGGAIYNEYYSRTSYEEEISNCTFHCNRSGKKGGAIFLNGVKSNLIISNCSFTNNQSAEGGALYSDVGTTPLKILNCTFSKNRSEYTGGAMFLNFGGVTIQNCMINNNNSDEYAGAIAFVTADVYVGNCIIANNRAKLQAGAFLIEDSSPIFINNTIVNNSGNDEDYAAITFWNYSAAEFYNNIIWGNTKDDGTSNQIRIWQSEESPVFRNCIIQKGDIYVNAIQQNAIFKDTICSDPKFENPTTGADIALDASLADWHIKVGSPAINEGDNNLITAKLSSTDFYNQSRIFNGIIDIGAAEKRIGKIEVSDTIEKNTIWAADTILVKKDIFIKDSFTLTISAGTTLLFEGRYKIIINGTLKAIGEKAKPIRFTVADTSGFWDYSNNNVGWKGLHFDNSAWYYGGADGAMNDNDTSYLENCIIEFAKHSQFGNTGGAINVRFFSRLVISDCMFKYNKGNWGGAIFLENQSSPVIKNNIFYNNYAWTEGGAIGIRIKCKPLIINNLISNNQALLGGGIGNYGSDPMIINNIITNNKADNWGGGIVTHYFGKPVIVNNTITYNNAIYGGGMQIWDETIDIYNTLIWNNEANSGSEISTEDNGANFYYCNIKDYIKNNSYVGSWKDTSHIISLDPSFVRPPTGTNSNGLEADFHIMSFSGNIDKGIANLPALSGISTDFFGKSRVNNSWIDIGAVENQNRILTFIKQPMGKALCTGDTITFSVIVSDTAKYQWQKDGVNLTNGNSPTYTINSVKESDEGNYSCVVSNSYGSVFGNPAFLKTKIPPSIIEQSKGTLIQKDATAEIIIKADGGKPLFYNWSRDAVKLSDTTSTLKIESFNSSNEGNYVCSISNNCGSINTSSIDLYLVPAICRVTVHNEINSLPYNVVYWNKESVISYSSYNIYRESSVTGYYDKIGSVSGSAAGQFDDKAVDPRKRSYMYKITGVKSNFAETNIALCEPHKTMHILVSESVNGNTKGNFQLDWDQYIGFDYSTFYITRSKNNGDYGIIDSVPTTSRTYIDVSAKNIASAGDNFYYYVSVKKAAPCNIGNRKAGPVDNGGSTSQIDFFTVRGPQKINDFENSFNFKCYPNPCIDFVNINYNLITSTWVKIELISELGEKISVLVNAKQSMGAYEFKINTRDLGLIPGVYILRLTSENKAFSYKLVQLKK